jgi:hypothetical protein
MNKNTIIIIAAVAAGVAAVYYISKKNQQKVSTQTTVGLPTTNGNVNARNSSDQTSNQNQIVATAQQAVDVLSALGDHFGGF